ncbi:MAG: hypothetical protein LV479_11490 [Methylacidiphilales bacterium]|nr:hypothetical protein [Candidatus Methylacidiphilales bacterium]
MKKKVTFHLLANAHLDPVWLWDWREGLNEGIITVRTILELMEEYPKMTFMRGEAAIYEHIEKTDPETFARIRAMVKAGRWDVIGGTYIQPDTNMPATETLARHFTVGQNYFQRAFGFRPRVAWAADSFGHSAGLPEILTAAGMTGFAFTRPMEKQFHLDNHAFWWESDSGARILCYRPTVGWYGTERDEIFRRFDGYLKETIEKPVLHVGCFYGLGNHGGGPSRRHLEEIGRWADKNPEVEVIHSSLHRFFDALAADEAKEERPYPVHRGELNFCLRGCYASVAKFKFPYRKTEGRLVRAEKTASIIDASLNRKPETLAPAWKSILFNSFHDILPGSSIERAYEEQLAWLGVAGHDALRVEFNALNALAAKIDTSVPKMGGDHPGRVALLVWNPHPHIYEGPVELEASLDYRPLWQYQHKADLCPVELFDAKKQPVPFQVIGNEHSAMSDLPWRKRVVFQAKLPPMSWSVYQMGLPQKATRKKTADKGVAAARKDAILNGFYQIKARRGSSSLQILAQGRPLFKGAGLSFINVKDPWGSWGGMEEIPDAVNLSTVQETWKIEKTEILEKGPERAALWVKFFGKRSWIDLTFFLVRGRPVVDVQARVLWNDRSSRLKMVLPVGDEALFEVPGGRAQRGICGEVPGGRWIRTTQKGRAPFGFATDALYGYDCKAGALRATIVRASRYANSDETPADKESWRPAVDAGELTFRFLFTTEVRDLPRLALELEQPLVNVPVSAHPGPLPRSGSLFSLKTENVQLLALKPAENGRGWIVRVQEIAGRPILLRGRWLNREITLGPVKAWGISTFRVIQRGKRWISIPTTIQEF